MVGKIRAVRIPTLIIQGDEDVKCILAVLKKLQPALQKNPKVRVAFVADMTHPMLNRYTGTFETKVVALIWADRRR